MAFWRAYYHLVWATKKRNPLLTPAIEHRLYPYLLSKAGELGVSVYATNGWTDHVHLIVAIPPKHAVADIVRRLKGASSHYLNQTAAADLPEPFRWQRGYGVLTLGERQRAQAEAYVRDQKEHHRRQTTNKWLENVEEFDEGPSDSGLSPDTISPMLREGKASYETIPADQFPF